MVKTRKQQPPEIVAPDVSNIYKLNYAFNDEKVLKADPFVDAITNFFLEADAMNKNIKALIAERTKKKVPPTPKKKAAATTLIRDQIEELRKISFDDEEEEDESFNIPALPSPPPLPRRQSPKKTPLATASQNQKKNNGGGGDAASSSSPVPSSSTAVNTPKKKLISSQKRNAVADALYSPSPVPRKKVAAKSFAQSHPHEELPHQKNNTNLEEKLRINAEKAEERRQKHLQETTEKLKRQNEEKERKIRERRAQMEEESRRKMEAVKLKEAKVREFEAKQREEAKIVKTPNKETKARTPRAQAKLKTPLKETVSEEYTGSSEKNQVPEVQVNNDEPLNYVEITEEEEMNIRKKTGKKGRALSVGDKIDVDDDNDRLLNYVELSVEELVLEESDLRRKTGKQIRPFSTGDVVQDSITDTVEVIPVVKVEPMEEEEYENDENVAPQQNKSSYDITADKVFLPSTETNYNVDDLSSNDETDDETKPRKTVPNWAKKHELNAHVKKMLKNTSTTERIKYFGSIQPPTLEVLFNIPNHRRHRHSSAVWQSPLHQPTAGQSRLPRH